MSSPPKTETNPKPNLYNIYIQSSIFNNNKGLYLIPTKKEDVFIRTNLDNPDKHLNILNNEIEGLDFTFKLFDYDFIQKYKTDLTDNESIKVFNVVKNYLTIFSPLILANKLDNSNYSFKYVFISY